MQPEYFVNVRSGSTVQGSGPLTRVRQWSVTRKLDAAGSWSFAVDAADPQASLLVLKRTVDIYAFVAGSYQLVGGGIIDRIVRQVNADGVELLRVEGGDDLRELMQRSALRTWLRDTISSTSWNYTTPGSATAVKDLKRGTSGRLVAGTGSGGRIYTSDDDGETWQDRGQLGSATAVNALFEYSPGVWFAGTDTGNVYTSDTDGTTWINDDTSAGDVSNVYGLGLVADETVAVAGPNTSNYDLVSRVWKGWMGPWVTERSPYTTYGARTTYTIAQGLAGGIYSASYNTYVYDEVNGEWDANVFIGNPYTQINALLYISSGVWWAATDDNGYIYESSSVSSWAPLGQTPGATEVTALCRVNSSLAYAGADGALFLSTNDGSTWTELRDLGSRINAIVALIDGTALVACENGRIYTAVDVISYSYDKISHADAVTVLEALAPAGWSFTPDASPINDEIYMQFAGESLLAAVALLAEVTQTHFYLSGSQALTFGDTWTASGVHVVQTLARALDAPVAALVALTVTDQSYDVVTRCYPYARLTGGDLAGIDLATSGAPTGYTLSTGSNYLQHTAAHGSYGLIERMVVFDEVAAAENGEWVGNALVAAAWSYLERRKAPVANYAVALAGCSELIGPMETVRLTYIGEVVVDGTLYVLESTWRGDDDGIVTAGLVVADAPVRLESDVDLMAATVKRVETLAAR